MWPRWFATRPSSPAGSAPEGAAPDTPEGERPQAHDGGPIPLPRGQIRVGIPRTLNQWSTHRFWIGFLVALGFDPQRIEFSSETSDEQYRQFGAGRGTVDSCWPVKCISGHYGELLARDKRPIQLLLSPMPATLPSFLGGAVVAHMACPRVSAAAENIRAGFQRSGDAFAQRGIRHVAPLVNLDEPALAARQLHRALAGVIAGLRADEVQRAVDAGLQALEAFAQALRTQSRQILCDCARADRPAILVLGRPYHMDPGIGHEIEVDLQGHGYPVLWAQHLPLDGPLLQWLFADDLAAGRIGSPLDIRDVWPSSYSANTNEVLWAAKFAARMPWIAAVVRLASYECGMDQPTYTPVQRIVEGSGTLFFSFQELDSTKPAGSVRIRVETIAAYLQQQAPEIIARKRARLAGELPVQGP